MFKRKTKSLPEMHPVVAIETTGTSDQITSFASKSQISTSQLSIQSKSSQIKSSKSSENIIKSDIIPTSASEPNLLVGDKSTVRKLYIVQNHSNPKIMITSVNMVQIQI